MSTSLRTSVRSSVRNRFFSVLAMPALISFAALPAVLVAAPLHAQDETALKVGSPAPALDLEWVQGKVENLSDASKTYVVEFWATWCGPCMRSIPHLNELSLKYKTKGLVIMGISDETMGKVKPFVTKKGSAMSYPVAIDTSEKATTKNWREAAKQDGIPCAFVVRDSKIVWIGNPLDPKFDEVVVGTLTGRYNPDLNKRAEPLLRAAKDAVRIKNFKDAWKHYDDVIALDPKVFGAVSVLKYKTMLLDAKDPTGANAWGLQVCSASSADAVTLAELATLIVTDSAIAQPDYTLAETAATAALKAAPSPASKALLAEVNFKAGDAEKAAALQFEAWMAADPSEKAAFKSVLDQYKKSSAAKAKL